MEKEIINLENVIIAAITLSPEKFPIVELTPEDFLSRANRDIFTEMIALNTSETKWDFYILASRLSPNNRDHLNKISNLDPVAPFLLTNYVAELKSLQTKNIVKLLCSKVSSMEPIEFAKKISHEYERINNQSTIPTMRERVLDSMKKMEQQAENNTGLVGISSGISKIDNILWGFQKQLLYILAARPSMGKSALAYNFALNAARDGKTVMIQSLEGSSHQILMRLVSNLGKISMNKVFRAAMNSDELSKYQKAMNDLAQLPIFIDDTPSLTSSEIVRRVTLQHAKQPLNLLIIDHLQEFSDKSQSRHLAISEGLSNIKKLGYNLNIPVIVLCQLSRIVEQSGNKRPMMSHLKESGDIEAKADVVMLLYRDEYYSRTGESKQIAEMAVAKSRDGRTGALDLKWEPEFMKFSDKDF